MATRFLVLTAAVLMSASGASSGERGQFGVGFVILPSARAPVEPAQTGANRLDRLPFQSGSYAPASRACEASPRLVITARAVSEDEGACAAQDIRLEGRALSFSQSCVHGAAVETRTRRWTRLSASRFSENGRSFRLCPGVVARR